MNAVSIGFLGIVVLICLFGFFCGIISLILEIKKRNNKGCGICITCMLLCFIFIVGVFDVAREKARRISCASNLKCIKLALQQYAMDHTDNFPPANGAAGLEYLRKYDYLTDYSIFICPSTKTTRGKDNQPLTEDIVDYVYVGGLTSKSEPNYPILYDKDDNHKDFSNVIFVDVKCIYGKPWTEKIKK